MKVIFIDRDGVINKYPGDGRYVSSWQEFNFLPNIKSALRKLMQAGYKIFVISNQAGVAKGIYSKEVLDEITNKMINQLNFSGVQICGVYYCIHRDEDSCSCRKPKAGLIKRALKEHNIPENILSSSFFVGDSIRDIQAGQNAGCRTILVFSGKEKTESRADRQAKPDFTAADLFEAVTLILGTHSRLAKRVSPDWQKGCP